jgi:hypothetical protein
VPLCTSNFKALFFDTFLDFMINLSSCSHKMQRMRVTVNTKRGPKAIIELRMKKKMKKKKGLGEGEVENETKGGEHSSVED